MEPYLQKRAQSRPCVVLGIPQLQTFRCQHSECWMWRRRQTQPIQPVLCWSFVFVVVVFFYRWYNQSDALIWVWTPVFPILDEANSRGNKVSSLPGKLWLSLKFNLCLNFPVWILLQLIFLFQPNCLGKQHGGSGSHSASAQIYTATGGAGSIFLPLHNYGPLGRMRSAGHSHFWFLSTINVHFNFYPYLEMFLIFLDNQSFKIIFLVPLKLWCMEITQLDPFLFATSY